MNLVKGCIILFILLFVSSMLFAGDIEDIQNLIEEGWWDDAQAVLDKQISQSPENPQLNFLIGKIHFLNQDYDNAEDFLETAIELNDTVSEYHLWLGYTKGLKAQNGSIFKAPGRAKACKREYARAVELDPTSIEARHADLQFHMQAPGFVGGDKKISYSQAEKIASLDSLRGYQARSMLYEFVEKDFPKTELELKAALETAPKDTSVNLDPYFWYGAFLNRRDRNTEAESLYFVAMAIDSSSTRLLINLAGLYEKQERYTEAISILDKAIAIEPTNLYANYNKGKMLIFSNTNLELAENIFVNYLNSKRNGMWPPYTGAHWRLAMVYNKQGKYDLAKSLRASSK